MNFADRPSKTHARVRGCLLGGIIGAVGVALSLYLLIMVSVGGSTGVGPSGGIVVAMLSVPAVIGVGVGLYLMVRAWRKAAGE